MTTSIGNEILNIINIALKEVIFLPDSITQIPADVRTFLEGLLEDAGLTLTDELRENMILDLFSRLEKKMIADAIERMQPNDVDEFTKLLEANTPREQLEKYLVEHLPNAQQVFIQNLS